jgi:hypothetical protein
MLSGTKYDKALLEAHRLHAGVYRRVADIWQDPDADFLRFGFFGTGENARLVLDSSAGAGAEPCGAERRRRRGCGNSRLNHNQSVRSSPSYYT